MNVQTRSKYFLAVDSERDHSKGGDLRLDHRRAVVFSQDRSDAPDGIVDASPVLQKVLEQISIVAPTSATVLGLVVAVQDGLGRVSLEKARPPAQLLTAARDPPGGLR
jgi:hypothetical protein